MIDEIRRKIADGHYEFSRHAVDQSILRGIFLRELIEAIDNATIIEDYPEDKYGPSCLLFGVTNAGRPIHIQCTYPTRETLKLITLYEPDEDLWIDFKTRRPANEG